MPTPADHFTAFLDSTPLTDRVLAGESRARFRRRILLERAAYLVLTTDRTLLDVAHDSGFTGQATFATAFRQEFGALPSVWRAEPTSYVIDAPSEVHFHPPAGLRLPARHRMDGTDLVVEMVEQHVRLVGELVDRARLVSDVDLDRDDLRSSLSRLIGQLEMLDAAVHDREHDVRFEAHESVTSMRRRLDRVGPAFVDDVSRLAATGRFDETFVDAFSPDPQVLSYGAMVAQVLTVGSHLRLLTLARLGSS
jgi:AraC-like DNA-binding protein